ncbi:MAG: PepSY domain-containing protein [Bacteroidales bacterium]|nr:PepSY domain-containing protein [Bacteroidales bacterium]
MQLKKITRKIHLWLGLPSSIIVFIICFTGSLFVFTDEIIDFSAKEISCVAPGNTQISVDSILDSVKKAYQKHILIHCINYKDKEKAALFVIANKVSGPSFVYVNPYNGRIIGSTNIIKFFSFVGHLHKQLMSGKWGAWIVLITSVIFIIELITGLIMWWPKNKNKKYFKNSLTIKRNTKLLRRLIDLHRVFGLYFIVVLLLLSITGVILFFLPKYGIEVQQKDKQSVLLDTTQQVLPLASIVGQQMKKPEVKVVKTELWNIEKSNEVQCIAGSKIGMATYVGKPYLINKFTGEIIEDAEIIEVIETRNVFRKLHLGDWLGWFGKVITFCTGLIGSFLAISAPMIWWKKKRRNV